MDTSETYKRNIVNPLEPLERIKSVKWYNDPIYTKMCDCPEIQNLRIDDEDFKPGDYIREKEFLRGEWLFILPNPMMEPFRSWGKRIWLPRQDQLQEMVAEDCPQLTLSKLLGCLYRNVRFDGNLIFYDSDNYMARFGSMEQLWLAFYMSEQHDKIWSGTEWIKK